MKKLMSLILSLGFILGIYAQQETYEELLEAGGLPEIVLKKAGEEFSVYLPDKHPDARVARLEDKFIAYNLDDKIDGENSYFVILKTEGAVLAASFSATGELMSVVERYKHAKLPENIRKSLAKKFPGWSMITDKYSYAQKQGRITKKEYKVIMKKDKKIKRVVVNELGEIIRGKL
ncbi:hypothetical protein [Pseudofulvibacter geojedonensis]|uniref:Uncharacterized protein n=1 Tax=Pseudofulvibacter geojedonensis TaxID=1123758 RepID=A0ABW3I2X8_9FLAO